jgi:large subunit ribosomal protein L19
MPNKIELFNKKFARTDIPDIKTGDTIKVYQKLKEGDKHKIQSFEGLVIAKKHGKGVGGTITIRKVTLGVGVERIFPIFSPNIEKIEIIKRDKARRSKLYYLKTAKGKKAKLKREEYTQVNDASAKEKEAKAEAK